MLPSLIPLLVPPGAGPSVPFIDGHLYLGLAVQNLVDLRFVTEDELLAWDHPFVRLCDHAVLGLRGRTDKHHLVPVEGVPGLLQVSTDDGLAASRMLCLEDLVRPWPLEGVMVACPASDQLLVVPLEGVSCIPALRALLRVLADWRVTTDALSDQLFWSPDGAGWVHVPVRHRSDGGADLLPAPGLVAAMERAVALDLVHESAEA